MGGVGVEAIRFDLRRIRENTFNPHWIDVALANRLGGVVGVLELSLLLGHRCDGTFRCQSSNWMLPRACGRARQGGAPYAPSYRPAARSCACCSQVKTSASTSFSDVSSISQSNRFLEICSTLRMRLLLIGESTRMFSSTAPLRG